MSDQHPTNQGTPEQPAYDEGAVPGPSKLPWLVSGVVLVVVLVAGGVVLATVVGDDDPTSVQEVADQAVEAAEDLDVDAAIDLLCDPPSEEERDDLEAIIEAGQEEAGTDDPEVDYEISDVEGDTEGSFHVEITSPEEELSGISANFDVTVEEDDGRSCIAGYDQ